MLTRLEIQNFALIDQLELDWNPGLTVITGETGSGKSILLGALGLILGERANLQAAAGKKCVVEGHFHLPPHFARYFEEADLDFEEYSILRREILANGKSRAFVNDVPATLEQLRNIADRLIDIHSQDDTRLLTKSSYQLELIDQFGGHSDLVEKYEKQFRAWKNAETELEDFRSKKGGNEDEDYLHFLLEELEAVQAKKGEITELEEEWRTLDSVTEIRKAVAGLLHVLDNEESGSVNGIRGALAEVEKLSELHSGLREISERLRSVFIELKDISDESYRMAEDIQDDPERLMEVETRMNLINTLAQKHHCSPDELPEVLSNLRQKLDEVAGYADRERLLEEAVARAFEDVQKNAHSLRAARKKCIPKLEKNILSTLELLNFIGVRFAIDLENKEYNIDGADKPQFLFSANTGQEMRPIQKVASGGEKSRIMLAIKYALAQTQSLPTLIFDEIDTGIGGETAARVAMLLKSMGKDVQLIAISHLPQIAAGGHTHWKVFKSLKEGRTRTTLEVLQPQERIDEIARMLSGDQLSAAARENAKELLGFES
jgi:DNA repair protein RecN (Recombination protein N)